METTKSHAYATDLVWYNAQNIDEQFPQISSRLEFSMQWPVEIFNVILNLFLIRFKWPCEHFGSHIPKCTLICSILSKFAQYNSFSFFRVVAMSRKGAFMFHSILVHFMSFLLPFWPPSPLPYCLQTQYDLKPTQTLQLNKVLLMLNLFFKACNDIYFERGRPVIVNVRYQCMK